MLGKILKLFVGDKSKKDLKLINPIIEKIHSFEQEMNSLSNDELRAQTQEFKKQIKDSTSKYLLKKGYLHGDCLTPSAFFVGVYHYG